MAVGDQVFINFTNSRDTTSGVETSTENDIVYTVASVPDPNTFTVAARDATNAAMNSDNAAFVFPFKSQPMVRNGTISARQSTYTMDNTDGDLQQTPLNSPTVFNFFLPDYKFSGPLAANELTTPEFELTSETTVIRQANFIYSGIFNPSNLTGISSFKSGSNSMVLDFSPWMGNAVATAGTVGAVLGAGPQTSQAWTSNANVGTLIDRLNTLLLGGTLPATVKTQIQRFIGGPVASVATGTPCVVTLGTHGLAVGDQITIVGVTGGAFSGASTSLSGTFAVASVPSSTTVTLKSTSSATTLNCSSISGLALTNSTASMGTAGYTNALPTDQNKRDRLRAIIHFILTSPDFTIQR